MQVAKQRQVDPTLSRVDVCLLRRVVRAEDTDEAESILRDSEIADYAGYIMLAVATSSPRDWFAASKIRDLPKTALTIDGREKFVDALFVIFMFNILNGVAMEFDVRPDWTTGGAFPGLRKRIFEGVLLRLVKLSEVKTNEAISVRLQESFEELDLEWTDLWKLFSLMQRLETGIQQILFAMTLGGSEVLASGENSAEQRVHAVFSSAVRTSVTRLNNPQLVSLIKTIPASTCSHRTSCENKAE